MQCGYMGEKLSEKGRRRSAMRNETRFTPDGPITTRTPLHPSEPSVIQKNPLCCILYMVYTTTEKTLWRDRQTQNQVTGGQINIK